MLPKLDCLGMKIVKGSESLRVHIGWKMINDSWLVRVGVRRREEKKEYKRRQREIMIKVKSGIGERSRERGQESKRWMESNRVENEGINALRIRSKMMMQF